MIRDMSMLRCEDQRIGKPISHYSALRFYHIHAPIRANNCAAVPTLPGTNPEANSYPGCLTGEGVMIAISILAAFVVGASSGCAAAAIAMTVPPPSL
jgi:hypothetical protein